MNDKMLKVRCPQCGVEFAYYGSAFRPFCTEKCKLVDLGHWFQESYVVPVKEHPGESENEEENNYEEIDEN